MLKDIVTKYYFDLNFNCAETILHAANEYYGLGLHERDMIMVAAYGAGMQAGNTCRAILSALSVLSVKYVEAKAHESEDIRPVSILLTRRIQEKYGSLMCKDIKPKYFVPEIRCLNTVNIACDVLEEVISEYEQSKVK